MHTNEPTRSGYGARRRRAVPVVVGASLAAATLAIGAGTIANAETTEDLDRGDLVVSVAQVDEGPTMKRWRPRAQGRATRILKRTSHITLVVQPADAVAAKKNKKGRTA